MRGLGGGGGGISPPGLLGLPAPKPPLSPGLGPPGPNGLGGISIAPFNTIIMIIITFNTKIGTNNLQKLHKYLLSFKCNSPFLHFP